LADTLGYFECRAKTHIDSGDHRIILAEVTHGDMNNDQPPYVHVRKNGLRYRNRSPLTAQPFVRYNCE
jgi:flavin reductase (DIM6/NTAB) family NADH-FMN oxidoreductase RutF